MCPARSYRRSLTACRKDNGWQMAFTSSSCRSQPARYGWNMYLAGLVASNHPECGRQSSQLDVTSHADGCSGCSWRTSFINGPIIDTVRPVKAPAVRYFLRTIYQGGNSPRLAKLRSIMYETPRTEATMNEPGPLAIVTAGQASKQGVTLHMYLSATDS